MEWVKSSFKRVFGMKKVFFVCVFFFVATFIGCSPEKKDVTLSPDNGLPFFFFPNDQAAQDSVEANLAYGTYFTVHPQGRYKISFDANPTQSAPFLQLHRISFNEEGTRYTSRRVRNLEATEINGRWEYSFICEESDIAIWATTLLGEHDVYYSGRVDHFSFEGEGPYSNSFNLNLIITGSFEGTADGLDEEDLASELLASLRKAYQGILIDTIFIRYAEYHPVVGHLFPKDEPWLAGTSSENVMLDELGGFGTGDTYNALDLVLVHRIDKSAGILGYSSIFSANLGGGIGSTIVLGSHMKITSTEESWLNADEIIGTAVHEIGHFFGLRHTTTTNADFTALGDYSSYEDGIEDTDWCSSVLAYASAKKKSVLSTDIYVRRPLAPKIYTEEAASYNLDNCPDASNIMFPFVTEVPIEGFTEGQLQIIRKNLSLIPH